MNIPFDTNLFAAMAIVLPLVAGGLLVQARRAASQRREKELSEAVDLLKTHTEAMQRLDDERVPARLLALACALSKVLHDPEMRPLTLGALRTGTVLNEAPSADARLAADLVASDYRKLIEQQPELAIAYTQALVAGVLAFDKRWPECAGQFALGLPQMVSSPVQEAQRIVREAGATKDWAFGSSGAIAA